MNAVQKKSWKKPKRRPQAMDYSILFLVLFLVGFGLVILYSTSSYKASLLYNDTTYWVKKQALFAAMGICGMLFIATRDYHIWQKKWWFAWVIYGGVIGLLLLTFYAEHSCNPLFLTTESNKRLQKNRNFPENPQIPQYES